MSAEFEELMKARDNPSEEAQSKPKSTVNFILVGPSYSICVMPWQNKSDISTSDN